MTIDGLTLLLASLGIAAVAAAFLTLEWRALREPALMYWAAGYGAITLGCGIAPLRQANLPTIGLWAADGLLIGAHLLFLAGMVRFVGKRPHPGWTALLMPWSLLLTPPLSDWPASLGVFNAALVALASLSAGTIGLAHRRTGSGRISALFLAHGGFYCAKTALAFIPNAFAGINRFDGFVIQLSLAEGVLVEVLLALLMAGVVRRRRELAIATLADRDPLTQAYNRRAFEQRVRLRLAALPAGRRLGALLLLDIDHFKPVNDMYGHAIGDETLVALTAILDAILPRNALIARYGGDEFVVFLPDAAPALVEALGDAICGEFARLNRYFRDVPITATVSIGAAMVADTGGDLAALMAAADAAAYEAKRSGGDQICLRDGSATRPTPAARPAA